MAANGRKMDLENMCRLCLAQGGVLSPIFQQESVGGGAAGEPLPPLPFRIMACATIKINQGDKLPCQICHRCLYQVERSYDFKDQCEKSDRILHKYLESITYEENSKDADKDKSKSHAANFSSKHKEDSAMDMILNGNSIADPKKSESIIVESSKSAERCVQSPFVLQEDDVDSGLLESLADSEDLQIVGSEGDGLSIADDDVVADRKLVPQVKDEYADKSESSDEEVRFRCKMCSDTFSSVNDLEFHETIHEAEGPPFSCAICQKTFAERSNLDAHWRVHCGDHPFLCPVCESPFASNESLENHLRTHKISRPYPCGICDKSFGNRSDLNKHSVIHSGIRPYKCSICPKEFSRTTNLNKHLRVHSGQRPYTCSECPKMFRTRGDLHRHEIIHTGQKPFSCSLCNLSFNRKDKLTRHERLHCMDKTFNCTFCPATFVWREELMKHSLMHISMSQKADGESRPEQVVATDLSMPWKKDLKTQADSPQTSTANDDDSTMDTESDHPLQICEDEPDQGSVENENGLEDSKDAVESMVISVDPFQMEGMESNEPAPASPSVKSKKSEPEKEEFSPNENEVEESIQENTKPYGCEFCPKKFADKSYMKTHQLTHLGIRPHACSYCGKGFFRRRELLRHEAVHTGIKPYSCKICQKAFARSDKLMRHERTHGDPKNYPCAQCPAVFSRKDELSRHGMCHTGERPHCCPQCYKSFFSKAELTRHEKTHANVYQCTYCDQSFHRRDKLKRHIFLHTNPSSGESTATVLGTVNLHDLLAQQYTGETREIERNIKDDGQEETKIRVDGTIDARALARLNQNPDINLIPLKQDGIAT